MSKMNIQSCGQCKFYEEENSAVGICQRFPPSFVGVNKNELKSYTQPLIYSSSWCGEYVDQTK